MPSSRWQICTTAEVLSLVSAKPGRAFDARSTNSSVASDSIERLGTVNVTSPGTPSACRDVARIESVGDADSSVEAHEAAAEMTCSQLSRTISTRRSSNDAAVVSSTGRPVC